MAIFTSAEIRPWMIRAGLIILALAFLAQVLPALSRSKEFGTAVLGAVAFFAYFLPTIVAGKNHPYGNSISVLNVLLGWTLIGWAVAMIWAVSKPKIVQQIVSAPNSSR